MFITAVIVLFLLKSNSILTITHGLSLQKELPLDDVEPCMQGLVTADLRADIMYRRQLAEQVAESFGYRFNVQECLQALDACELDANQACCW